MKNQMLRATLRGCIGLFTISFALMVHAQDFAAIERMAEQGNVEAQNNLGWM
jgi:TPR repeat protein